MKTLLAIPALAALALGAPLGAPLGAQQKTPSLFVEGRGGVVAPTFDIADVAKTGGAFGATIGYRLDPRWSLMGEFDYGMHEDEDYAPLDLLTPEEEDERFGSYLRLTQSDEFKFRDRYVTARTP